MDLSSNKYYIFKSSINIPCLFSGGTCAGILCGHTNGYIDISESSCLEETTSHRMSTASILGIFRRIIRFVRCDVLTPLCGPYLLHTNNYP